MVDGGCEAEMKMLKLHCRDATMTTTVDVRVCAATLEVATTQATVLCSSNACSVSNATGWLAGRTVGQARQAGQGRLLALSFREHPRTPRCTGLDWATCAPGACEMADGT